MAGPGIFFIEEEDKSIKDRDELSRQWLRFLLAVLNSEAARRMLNALNPTLHYQVRDVRSLPLPSVTEQERGELARLSWELVCGWRVVCGQREGDPCHGEVGVLSEEEREGLLARLDAMEREVHERICAGYGVELEYGGRVHSAARGFRATGAGRRR
jgi:hypothetical protein